ncbi:acrosin-like [Pithys albifrons albifrons]|uniref:acrosin-like n=1 Tax=Pithys albifrons albifrons TaxID=3385563 RepID=UPI003A5CB985
MAGLWLLVLLALAGPVGGTWDSCRGTCGLRPMASDHSSLLPDYDPTDAAQGSFGSSGGIVPGNGVASGTWPGIVSIQATWANGTWHMCSGSLINPKWVLTVAHCFFGAGNVTGWQVVIGATDLTQPGPETQIRHIQRLLVHQNYMFATGENNIALLELEEPLECSDYIQLGCVPDTNLRVSELRSCYIAGWRTTMDRALRPRLALQEAKVRLIDVQLCNSSRWYAGAVPPHDLCAGYPRGGIDTCQGDSGGPLVCKDNTGDFFWLVGMTSWGKGCAEDKRFGVFTCTQHFYDWILLQMGLVSAVTASPTPQPVPTPAALKVPTATDSDMPVVLTVPKQILFDFLEKLEELLKFLKDKMDRPEG